MQSSHSPKPLLTAGAQADPAGFTGRWRRLTLRALSILGVLISLAIPRQARAEDTEAEIRELRARVEAMERQNDELQRRLEPQTSFVSDPKILPPPVGVNWHEAGSDLSMTASWKHGVQFETRNHDFMIHVGGRTQLDTSWYNADESVQNSLPAAARFRDGVDFRRARFTINGRLYETMEWTSEFDFVNSVASGTSAQSVVAPTDLWWQFNQVPVLGSIRLGNHKEAIGFEHLTSSRFLNFMERSFDQDAFYGGFNNGFTPGISFFNSGLEERATWSLGLFKPTVNAFAFSTVPGEFSTTGRFTYLPCYVDDGRGLLHVGISARYHEVAGNTLRYRTRASARSGLSAVWPVIADTGAGVIHADSEQSLNLELVSVLGPLSIACEFLTNWTQNTFTAAGGNVGPLVYRGGYVEALYFLTGEHRAYNRKTGVFDRVVPDETAFLANGEEDACNFGRGAWQVGARYSFLDLNDDGVNGGILHDMTLGLNWFLNPNTKVQWNYFLTHREAATRAGDGVIQGLGMRFAHDF